MTSLRRLANDLSIPQRTLRRAAREGLIHGDRVSPRKFRTTLREEHYLRHYWKLLHTLREAFRTEPNTELAVLFGSTATATDSPSSDIDVLVILRDPDMGRLATMAERLSARVGREIQLVRLSDAEASPILMDEILKHGRVLIDRDARWPSLQATAERWRRRARRAEESLLAAATEHSLDRSTA